MTRYRKLLSFSIGLLTATTLATASLAADAPVKGGTLVYLEQQAHTNLYPPAGGFYPNGGILNQITDKLTYQNPKTLEIEPWLAESWTVNDNATEYTFKLRPGVTFSDGTPVDAAAVAKNFDTYGLGNKELKQPVSEVVNNYDHSEVIDPLTVKFTFKKPSPGFLQGTSVIGSGIVSLSTLALPFEQLGDATKIIGSGPFVVNAETLGKSLDLKVREDYNWGPAKLEHQGRAYLDEINYIITAEDSVRIGALLAGQADFIRQIQAYDEGQVEAQSFTIYAPGTRGVNNSIVFRPDNPLVADLKVRKALSLAVNRDEILSTIFSKNYPKATSIIASTAIGYVAQEDKLGYDPEKAEALLDEAGFKLGADGIRAKDGQKLVLTSYESLPQPQSRAVLQLIAQQWSKLGVKLNVLAGDAGSKVVDELDPLKTPVAVAMVGRADPDVIKSQYYPTNRNVLVQKGGVSDKVKTFSDDRLNEILNEIASQPDREKRLKAVADAQAYVLDQAYAVPIFEEPQAYAGAPYVKGVAFEAVGRPAFYSTWLDK
ncbi:ABC transporter substrate-binding protein [Rhizobium wenxiniae]|uniref:Peptide/nickel transport system substrate-binding protein n=1 Tax=Rhizobium wenxiniae TaxID=1737357 RepID=A0A7W9Y8K2_9HYPH|nr:TIGR04028 family ABC transporter substrate-binding protein [Rhizobium wenxiniae]MBB6163997.1 peptide/nickel transport system substrate-binding protein [Rhizobium wenxiniae]GGG04119.1 ABC transporter substrate-binding protein [Rhizobium wenxiniae]